MPTNWNRRAFLQACQVGAIATVAVPWIAGATEPVQRNGTPKFKFSLAAYSYRKFLTGKQPEMTLFDFADDCAKMQLEGTELTAYYFATPITPEYLRKLKAHCFRLGLDVSGTATRSDFGHPAGEARQKEINELKQAIDNAEILGAPVIRIFAGDVKKGTTPDEAHQLMVAGMEECCEYAGKRGIYLALENHGGPTATADGLMKLVNDVKSPWCGVNLDTGNFRSDDVYGDLARAAPYALNVQVKVVLTERGKKQPMDFKRLAEILRKSAYRGYIVLEYEEDDDPRKACPEIMDQIRAAFSA